MKNKKTQPQDLEVQFDKKEQDTGPTTGVLNEEKTELAKMVTRAKRKTKKPAETPLPMESHVPSVESLTRHDPELTNQESEDGKPDSGEKSNVNPATGRNRWLPVVGAAVGGLVTGFLLGYFILIMPLQNQLASITEANFNGNSSSNKIKSDLSTTKLKQQEMETRYQAASDQLESANQYIFLLRMKEQIAVARLMVEQKEGLLARQSLAEIQSRFDHLKPFVMKKDVAAAGKLDELIKISIQHLASDPESVKSDLAAISDQLNGIETTLFQPE